MELQDNESRTTGFDRRSFMRRAAVVGAATAWATPTVQSLTAPAFATGTPVGGCTARMTGGGRADMEVSNVTFYGTLIPKLTFGLGQLLCLPPPPGTTDTQIQVNAHPGGPTTHRAEWHFTIATITCSKQEPNPSPGPNTIPCANVFTGTATDRDDPQITLSFRFADHGEGGPEGDMDTASITITDPDGTVALSGAGNLLKGNLQVHSNIPGIQRDCSGC